MKKFLTLFFLLGLVSARAELITATVTITNAPVTNGMTFVVNRSTRTWTNAVYNTSSQILTNSTIGGIKTNLALHIGGTPFPGVTYLNVSTNSFKLIGTTVSVSFSGAYGEVSYTTNTLGVGQFLRLPFTGQTELTNRTNNANWIVDGLNGYATTAINASAPLLTNFLDNASSKTISGANLFTGANVLSNASTRLYGGILTNVTVSASDLSGTVSILTNGVLTGQTITNATIVNAAAIGGTVTRLTNGVYVNPTLTNGVNRGLAFSSPGPTGTGSEQFGDLSTATNDEATAVGYGAEADGIQSSAFGSAARAIADATTAIGAGAYATGNSSVAIGTVANATADYASAIGTAANATHTRSTAVGYQSATTAPDQLMLGSSGTSVQINNRLVVGTYIVNPSHSRTNNSSLANGNNAAVSIADRGYVKVSGPTAAFTINGIAGGSDGRIVTIQNSTGYTLTIANDSGTDPTAGNRIYTGTGGDITQTNNPGVVTLIYDSAASRWVVTGKN